MLNCDHLGSSRLLRRVFAVAAIAAASAISARGQDVSAGRLADTSSPRATLLSFIDACNEFHSVVQSDRFYDRRSEKHRPVARRILDCMDMSEIPEFSRLEAAGESAICIKEILDRVTIPPFEEIPDLDAIEAAGGPEKMVRWHLPGSRLSIGWVSEGEQKDEYLFRPGTVARAPEYFEEIQELPYRTSGPKTSPGLFRWYHFAPGNPQIAEVVNGLPDWFQEMSYRIARWKWIGLALAIAIAAMLMTALYWSQRKLKERWIRKSLVLYCLTVALPLLAVLVPVALKRFIEHTLTIRGPLLYLLSFSIDMITLAALVVVTMTICNRVAEVLISPSRINTKGINAQFVRIVCNLAGIAISTIILLEGGQYLGVPVTTLLASAGVGGLAVALAAQHSLKNVIGTMMLMADKPFRVGDRIVVAGYDGIVENIGLRSTRIRLLNSHVVTMPNDELAETNIENIGGREHIRRSTNLHIPLDTPLEKLERSVELIRKTLDNHEGMDPDFPPRVFFDEFNPDSFNLRVMYWFSPPNYWDFLAFSEKLNLEICRIFKEQEIRFYTLSRVAHAPLDTPSDL